MKKSIKYAAVFCICLFVFAVVGKPVHAENTGIPGKVSLKEAKATASDRITITWTKTENATEYRIYRKESGKWRLIGKVGGEKSKFVHISSTAFPIELSSSYVYTVKAYNSKTKKSGAFEKNGIRVYSYPKTPVLLKTEKEGDNVRLSWEKVEGVTSYCIYYRSADSGWKKIGNVRASSDSYLHVPSEKYPLNNGTIYYYTVRAYNKVGKVYSRYDKTGISVKIPPAKTVLKEAKITGKTVALSWEKAEGATHYAIYYKVAGQRWKKMALVRACESTIYLHKNSSRFPIKEGTTCYYTVRAYNEKENEYGPYQTKGVSITIPEAEKMEKKKSTLKNLLQTALQPVGSTLYIYGGAWNIKDSGAGTEAVTIGVSSTWEEFYQRYNETYNHKAHAYETHNGLDCSGFIGWCIYNVLNTKSGNSGYVMDATFMARKFAEWGWGSFTYAGNVKNFKAGDIMSTSGHVYMVVGQCADGSVVLLHSSPPGVHLCGTPSKKGKKESQAVKLAEKYMKTYYPDWYAKFSDCSRGTSYLTSYNQMRWDITGNVIMSDPDGYRSMSADEILKDLFQ